MDLSQIFESAAIKKLVAVDLPNRGSNQHEINGHANLRAFFGTESKTTGPITWLRLGEDVSEREDGQTITFYDAREKSATRTGRSEWRLYYSGDFLSQADPGDLLVLARLASDGSYVGLSLKDNSTPAAALVALFGIKSTSTEFEVIEPRRLKHRDIEFVKRRLLELLEIDAPYPAEPDHEKMVLSRFGKSFPSTKGMAEFAREVAGISFSDPDKDLIVWLNTEESLFRALEKTIVTERLNEGFESVDQFFSYSLSMQNRRKARMGYALQNHLNFVLEQSGLLFDAQARTERKNCPDFLFPGEVQYKDPSFPLEKLFMLAAKSTAKERWRQILTEAEKINTKHLCTIEPAISIQQTTEMKNQGVVLVLPEAIGQTYTSSQQAESITLGEFISIIQTSQAKSS